MSLCTFVLLVVQFFFVVAGDISNDHMLCGVSRTHAAPVQDTAAYVFNCSHVIVVMVFRDRGFCNLMGNVSIVSV